MTEGALPPGAPRKGKRSPEIAARLLAEQMEEQRALAELASPELEPQDGVEFIRSGRTISMRTQATWPLPGGDPKVHLYRVAWEHTETIPDDVDIASVYAVLKSQGNHAVIGAYEEIADLLSASNELNEDEE